MTLDSGDKEVEHAERKWSLKLQGKLMNGMSDTELKHGATTHMMSYFDAIKIEFAEKSYETIEWAKSTDKQGSTFDAFEVCRPYKGDEQLDVVSGTIYLSQCIIRSVSAFRPSCRRSSASRWRRALLLSVPYGSTLRATGCRRRTSRRLATLRRQATSSR